MATLLFGSDIGHMRLKQQSAACRLLGRSLALEEKHYDLLYRSWLNERRGDCNLGYEDQVGVGERGGEEGESLLFFGLVDLNYMQQEMASKSRMRRDVFYGREHGQSGGFLRSLKISR